MVLALVSPVSAATCKGHQLKHFLGKELALLMRLHFNYSQAIKITENGTEAKLG
jgi:hypothetical protein